MRRTMTTTMMMAAMAARAWASETTNEQRSVAVCVVSGRQAITTYSAEILASKMFAEIGVTLHWRSGSSCDGSPEEILVSYSERTPTKLYPRAMAYALPFEG